MDYLKESERGWSSGGDLDYDQAMAILEGLREEALALGVWPPEDPLEGIEVDIRIARTLNSCTKNLLPE